MNIAHIECFFRDEMRHRGAIRANADRNCHCYLQFGWSCYCCCYPGRTSPATYVCPMASHALNLMMRACCLQNCYSSVLHPVGLLLNNCSRLNLPSSKVQNSFIFSQAFTWVVLAMPRQQHAQAAIHTYIHIYIHALSTASSSYWLKPR